MKDFAIFLYKNILHLNKSLCGQQNGNIESGLGVGETKFPNAKVGLAHLCFLTGPW